MTDHSLPRIKKEFTGRVYHNKDCFQQNLSKVFETKERALYNIRADEEFYVELNLPLRWNKEKIIERIKEDKNINHYFETNNTDELLKDIDYVTYHFLIYMAENRLYRQKKERDYCMYTELEMLGFKLK